MAQPLLTEALEKTKQRIARREVTAEAARSGHGGSLSPFLQLQRTLGNSRVTQLIQAKRLTPQGKILNIQPKLTVGPADDHLEQEADRVSRQVVSMPDSVALAALQPPPPATGEAAHTHSLQSKPLPLAASITPFVQRAKHKGADKEEDQERDKPEEAVQAKRVSDPVLWALLRQQASEKKEEKPVQAKHVAETSTDALQRQSAAKEEERDSIQAKPAASLAGSFDAGEEVESRLSQSKGGGSPLPDPVRAFMEPRFGVDFCHVRVHTGSNAVQMNRDIAAQAFTHGSDIYYGAGSGPTNLDLTAHELTHVVQQTGGALSQATPPVQRLKPTDVGEEKRTGPPHTTTTASEDGKPMYRTSGGQMVELPPDMTDEDAARLEAEAKVAEKRLGKGPPPKPVPTVKKQAKKDDKREKPPPRVKSKKGDTGKLKASPKAAGAATARLEAVGPSDVAQYLTAKGSPVLLERIGMLQKLKHNEQTHDDATAKLKQSEKAVVITPNEGQSESNTVHVNAVSAKPAPTVDANKAKQKLQDSLHEHIPHTIEDVDNFKRDKKAQHMGADVMTVVQVDKNAVISTFADMEHTPPPTPPEHKPEPLPPEEIAPPTPNLNLGQGAIAPLQQEHTDLSHYTKEADSRLKEEEITQEQLDMVDSGDLAEANKEKKGMEATAKSEPLTVQKFAQQEAARVDKTLKQEEKQDRDGLKAKRKANLGATKQHQKGAKTALEKQREEVADKINGVFKAAQDKVKTKLADLETQSMKRFDDGNAKATKEFEDNVNRELAAYKEDRYSGFFGWARKAKDWLLGMDDLPGVKAIFERNRATFVDTINTLVENITTDNKRVIQECKDELAKAKETIKTFVDKLRPDLIDIGKKAAQEMNAKLEELDRFVANKEQELQDKLKDKQQSAIKAIDEKIEKMKEAMAGALAKLGKLLLWAAKKFFTWALQKFGYSLEEIEGIINKGAAVLKAIFTKPIPFVKNLINAASTGFKNFAKNFLTHLKDAVFEWLTGSLEGLTLPASWDLKGILSVVFQMLGITYHNIRSHLVKLIPEPVVKTMETTFSLVKALITEGPMAAWEQLKDIAGEMKDTFIDAVKDWIKWKVVEEAVKTILAMFIPGAGIIRAIIGIYDTVVFFIQKAKDIMQMIGSFLGSIAEIAAGDIAGAAAALENGLARGLKLVIDFLAKFLRLDGITQKIRDVIQKIRSKVDDVIARVARWIVNAAQKAGKNVAAAITGTIDKRTMQEKERDVQLAKRNAQEILGNSNYRLKDILASLPKIKATYQLTSIALENLGNGQYDIMVQINPAAKTEKRTLKGGIEIPDTLKVGLYIKFAGQIWKVQSIDPQYVIISHATNVNDTKRFVTELFVKFFLNGQYPVPNEKEIKELESIDPNWENKIVGNPQTTGTPGHAEHMRTLAEQYAKMPTVKFVYLDRQYRTVTVLAGNKLTNERRPDLVIEHVSGRLDVVEVRSKTDDPRELSERNLEVIAELPKERRGSVTVWDIPGFDYSNKK